MSNAHPAADPPLGRCPFRGHFFALTYNYVEKVTYEQIFLLVKKGAFSFIEAYNFPIKLREWFVRRLIKDLESNQ